MGLSEFVHTPSDQLKRQYPDRFQMDFSAGTAVVMRSAKVEKEKEPLRKYSYWKTHPNISQRISVVNQEVTGKLEFKDYMNLIGGN